MQERVKVLNPQKLLESLCCGFFAGLLVYLVRSEKYLSYVTPRMKPYLYFSALVMGIWAIVGLLRLFQPQYKTRSMHCFVLAVPVLMLLLPHSPLEISDVAVKSTLVSGLPTVIDARPSSDNWSTKAPGSKGIPDASAAKDNNAKDSSFKDSGSQNIPNTPAAPDNASGLPGLDMQNKKITVSNDDFALWLAEIDSNSRQYEGYTIVMTGYVMNNFKIPKENEFIVSRLAMTCCIADVSPTGLRCIYDKASELGNESWVTVEGTLSIVEKQYNDITLKEPQIHVTNITPTDPVEGYVYPFV